MNWTADFPILAADENGNRLVYLDSAATTQHPMQVLNAVVDYYTKENANPHRGVYELAMRATDAHEGARHTVAQFFNAEDNEIVFTQNTTESLNLIAYSYGMNFLHEGDEIVISVAEHHSNMVPWQRVAKHRRKAGLYVSRRERPPDHRGAGQKNHPQDEGRRRGDGLERAGSARACRRNCEACPRRGRCGRAGLRPERAPHPRGRQEAGRGFCGLLCHKPVRPPWASVRCTHAPDCWKRCPRS